MNKGKKERPANCRRGPRNFPASMMALCEGGNPARTHPKNKVRCAGRVPVGWRAVAESGLRPHAKKTKCRGRNPLSVFMPGNLGVDANFAGLFCPCSFEER